MSRWLVVVPISLAACAFEPAGGVGPDAGAGGPDAGGRLVTVRDDGADDFTADGTTAEAIVVEPWGAIAPAGYHVGGLIARLANARRFTDEATATWAEVIGDGAAGTSFARPDLDATPVGVGAGGSSDFTYWLEGELWLDAGTHELVLRGDDLAFVDLARPGEATYTRVTTARWSSDGRASYTAPWAGWYPVRMAVKQDGGGVTLSLRVRGPGDREPVALGAERLRARADGLRGTVLAAWDGAQLRGTPRRTLFAGDLVDRDFAEAAPADLGLTDDDYWSVRWTGQVYVTHPGRYQLRVDTDDGQRLYLAGARRIEALGGGATDRTATVDLTAGWNDLVLDHNETTGRARARLRVIDGPDPELGRELPLARLRPVTPRFERVETGVDPADRGVPDDGDPVQVGESTVDVVTPPDAIVTSIDVGVTVDHPRVADLEVHLIHPDGTAALLRDHDAAGGNGVRTWQLTTEAFDGKPARGPYRLRVRDTASGSSGRLTDFAIAVHHRGGPPPIATDAAWTSAVRDLGPDVTTIERVRLGARVPDGAGVQLLLRTCAAPEACAAEPWSPPVDGAAGDGGAAAPRVAPRRYLQYRIELTSDGEREPEVDWVEIDYRTRAM